MSLLIAKQLRRFSEGYDGDGHIAPVEFGFERPHLTEMRLTRESGKMAQKDQQQARPAQVHEPNRVSFEAQ